MGVCVCVCVPDNICRYNDPMGRSYMGKKYTTVSNKRCSDWSNQRAYPADQSILLVFRDCCTRCRFQPYDCVIIRSWSRFDIVSLCYVLDDGTLGCRQSLHIKLKDAQGRDDGWKVTGSGFLSGVRDSTGILLILLTDSVSTWHL